MDLRIKKNDFICFQNLRINLRINSPFVNLFLYEIYFHLHVKSCKFPNFIFCVFVKKDLFPKKVVL